MNTKISVNGFSVLMLRMLLSGIFIVAGVSHLLHPDKVANRINNAVLKNTAFFFWRPLHFRYHNWLCTTALWYRFITRNLHPNSRYCTFWSANSNYNYHTNG